jgi:hypothetical protein
LSSDGKKHQPCLAVRRILLLSVAVVIAAACDNGPPEFGVSVFANDTLPVQFSMDVTGTLAMGIRAQGFEPGPNKTLYMTTPAQLLVQRGEGTATITALRGGSLLVQPLGVNPDSGDTSSAQGMVVKLARPTPTQRSLKLTVEKP